VKDRCRDKEAHKGKCRGEEMKTRRDGEGDKIDYEPRVNAKV
jgi:hypothetical protein